MLQDGYTVGNTALLWAADNGHQSVVEMLINAGASLDIQSDVGIVYDHVERLCMCPPLYLLSVTL